MKSFRDGQERQSGTIRTTPTGTRRRRNNQEPCEEARHSPADGATGDLQRDPAEPEKDRTEATEARSAERTHRADAGGQPASAAQTAAHRASDLDQAMRRASRVA